ncbi:hypothetical protein E2C01_064736 [Portunus trituberculatus]|uniref:Uncharacterized protein n=1 Tax=Portunus trituberculatus TaxID=210409 RepID=A0A5B7HKL9_PORTR|nr:hypothetical protein [Portunus trituberculatus]
MIAGSHLSGASEWKGYGRLNERGGKHVRDRTPDTVQKSVYQVIRVRFNPVISLGGRAGYRPIDQDVCSPRTAG